MLWTVVSAIASVAATVAALATVRLTINYRREERTRVLADALIAMISATEKHPGVGVDLAWDARFDEAIRQVERATALSLLGLSGDITTPVLDLLDPATRQSPERSFMLATRAFERLLAEGRGPTLAGQVKALARRSKS